MPIDALLLALGAATLHATWNLLLRRSTDTEAATAVSAVVFVLVLVPFAAATWNVDAAAWKYIVPSGLLELVYLALLAAAYRRYELSLVYPVARGLAPVAALLYAVAIVGADPSSSEIVGVVVVAGGVLLVRGARGSRGAALGLAIAAVIGGYTLVDRYGIQHANAFSYALLILLPSALIYPLFVGPGRVRSAVEPSTVLVGVLSASAYLLVLLALRQASAPAVAAVRETGVVIAAFFGAVFLHERVGLSRYAGAGLVVAGIALLALA
jgi:drug/metabolite transporter (DMT)-like permease